MRAKQATALAKHIKRITFVGNLKEKVQPSGGSWDIKDWWQILGSGHMYINTSDHRGALGKEVLWQSGI